MLRVMLVDDEPMALEGLQLLIDWQKEGFSVVGCCASGAEALEQLTGSHPDLIVTDLRMPEVDGLTLIREAQVRGYEGQFIIVSGYSDFENARQALTLGVAGYILKPIDADDASQAIESARKKLQARAQAKRRGILFPTYQSEISALLTGMTYQHTMIPQGGQWRLATWGAPLPIDKLQLLQIAVSESGSEAAVCILDEHEWLALFSRASTEQAVNRLYTEVSALGRMLYVSEVLSEPALLYQTRLALDTELSQYAGKVGNDILALERLLALRMDDALMVESDALQMFCEARGQRAIQQALTMWRSCCAHQFDQVPDKLAMFTKQAYDAQDIASLSGLTIRLLSTAQKRISDVVFEYAQSHYGDNLTLDGLAAKLGYNPAYLGRVFSKETGISFRAWLSDLRMRKAAEMLSDTQTTIANIAYMVGFNKYQYFLDTFKSVFHVTPDAYRHGERGKTK